MNAVFLIGENPFDCCTVFSHSLANSLKNIGWKVDSLFISEKNGFKGLQKLFDNPPDVTLSFSDIHLDNRSFGTLWSVPHISLLADPVMYSLHQCLSPNCYVTVSDLKEVEFLKKQNRETLFLPHAVDKNFSLLPVEEKEIDLLFFGTLIDPELIKKRWKEFFTPVQRKQLNDLCEHFFSTSKSILDLLQEYQVTYDLWPKYHFEIDHYTRMKERTELLRECKDLPLTIYGKGPYQKICPKAKIFFPCSFTETMKLMKKAKAVLNSSIRFKNGAHERIFFSMAARAVAITGCYPFINTQFKEGKEFLGFYPHKLEGLSTRIYEILDSKEKREQITEKAWEKVINRDTFDHRAIDLKNFCENLPQQPSLICER